MAMNKSKVAYLVSKTYTQNEYGVMERNEQKRKVYVNVSSINQNEWFEGGRNGLNPELRFTMFAHDYQGEEVIECNGIQYTIYRTYIRRKDEIELYTQKRKGNE
jgi:hypothetical protein